jgi:hypothetical protein
MAASKRTLPFSRDKISARSSASESRVARAPSTMFTRSALENAAHAGQAACAAITASSAAAVVAEAA